MCLFSHDTSSSEAVSGEEEVRNADSGGRVLWEITVLTVLVLCRLRAKFATGACSLSLGLICCREPALLRVSLPQKIFTVGEKVVYVLGVIWPSYSLA